MSTVTYDKFRQTQVTWSRLATLMTNALINGKLFESVKFKTKEQAPLVFNMIAL